MKRFLIALAILLFLPSFAFAGTIATSSITAADIIADVQADLNDDSSTFYTADNYYQWIDEAITEIVNRTRCLEETVFTITLSEDTWSYDVGQSYTDIETIFYDSGVTSDKQKIFTVKKQNIREIAHSKETGRPKVYCLWADKVLVWPIPGSDESGTTLHVYAVEFPSGVTTSTSPIETPAPLDPAIVHYVKAKALFKDSKELKGQYFMGLFDVSIKNYILNILRRNESDVIE